jgi:hypothetical protein
MKMLTKLSSLLSNKEYKPVKFVLNSPNEYENFASVDYEIASYREITDYGRFWYEQKAVVICKDTGTKDQRGLPVYVTETGISFVYLHSQETYPPRGIFALPATGEIDDRVPVASST